ncbi:hypothetical protein K7432_005783 [Basidiobolus ranarum]|uniref:Uncharacterized protein n=1 Tax=Basidiobolus ranarum TaxID=34480 RepID=A0ABR2W2M3_9FUNG
MQLTRPQRYAKIPSKPHNDVSVICSYCDGNHDINRCEAATDELQLYVTSSSRHSLYNQCVVVKYGLQDHLELARICGIMERLNSRRLTSQDYDPRDRCPI